MRDATYRDDDVVDGKRDRDDDVIVDGRHGGVDDDDDDDDRASRILHGDVATIDVGDGVGILPRETYPNGGRIVRRDASFVDECCRNLSPEQYEFR